MNIMLNDGQKRVRDAAIEWFFNPNKPQVFQYSGGPGTGKTTILKEILYYLNLSIDEIAPMSYIGAAVINMRRNGLYNAKTIHSWLFNPIDEYAKDKNGNLKVDPYYNRAIKILGFEPKPYHEIADHIKLFIIDEGSCVPRSLRKYIESYNIPIIVTGDINQLPPVKDEPAYLYNQSEVLQLTQIMRQGMQSPIIQLAQRSKQGLPINCGFYNNDISGDYALVIYEDQLDLGMIAQSDVIICGKNDTKEAYNNLVRKEILGVDSKLPAYGERLICRKNNWSLEVDGISLANGLMGTVSSHPDISNFDGKCFYVDFKPNMLDDVFRQINIDYEYLNASSSKKEFLKNNKFNEGNKFDYAYAITSHLSQGSQFSNVIYIEEYLNPLINDKLNYVGITRAVNSLIYVKKRPKMNYIRKR